MPILYNALTNFSFVPFVFLSNFRYSTIKFDSEFFDIFFFLVLSFLSLSLCVSCFSRLRCVIMHSVRVCTDSQSRQFDCSNCVHILILILSACTMIWWLIYGWNCRKRNVFVERNIHFDVWMKWLKLIRLTFFLQSKWISVLQQANFNQTNTFDTTVTHINIYHDVIFGDCCSFSFFIKNNSGL